MTSKIHFYLTDLQKYCKEHVFYNDFGQKDKIEKEIYQQQMRGRVATHEVMIFIYQFHRENQWGETFFEEQHNSTNPSTVKLGAICQLAAIHFSCITKLF